MESVIKPTQCRICSSNDLELYLDLGTVPLANSYLDASQKSEPEFTAPLALNLCKNCGLSQLTHVVNPEIMYRHYLYVSSTPKTFRDHCDELAKTVTGMLNEEAPAFALDIASNDGCLLRSFQKVGFKTIGVDPARNLAKEANENGVETLCEFWSPDIAQTIVSERGSLGVITATNVFAHVHDVHAFMEGVSIALDPNGICVLEFPYVIDFIERNLFDTVYHEHLSYVGLGPVANLVEQYGLEVISVERFYDLHGGTIRIVNANKGRYPIRESVSQTHALEKDFQLTSMFPYREFAHRVEKIRSDLVSLLQEAKKEGRKICGYGASAKGNTLLNYFGLNAEIIDYIVDDNPKKWALYTPGTLIPICGIEKILHANVDDLLLLAWNFAKEIQKRCEAVDYQGDFIYPVPEPKRVKSSMS